MFLTIPFSVNRVEVLDQFEVLYAQLVHHKPQSEEQIAAIRTRLSDLDQAYCGSPIDIGNFLMTKECFHAVRSLQSNNDILIIKPDKGSDVVILNKHDYVLKMDTLLHIVKTQHVIRLIKNHHSFQDRSNLFRACKTNSTSQIIANESAIEQHILENPFCASQFSDTKFCILAPRHTFFPFLKSLEATFIKSFQSNLYQHKEFL